MRLHYSPGSCSLAVHAALEEAGADFEAVRLDLAAGDQFTPGFLALNPKGRVPVLETAHGPLTEVAAILGYVAATHPEAELAPADAFGLARMNAVNAWISSTVHVAIAHGLRGYRWADTEQARADMAAKAVSNYSKCFDLIDRDLAQGPWMLGHAISTSDFYVYLMTRWLPRIGLDTTPFPNVADHYRRMCERPSVRRALATQGLS
nr:glutathione S-transferase N-terminal domain-containing protein [Sphingomonas corticis]